MKTNFSSFAKLFLAGICFVAVGCTDYGQDIQNLNDRIDALETGKITALETDLAAVSEALEAAKGDLQGQINTNKGLIEELTKALGTAEDNIEKALEDISKLKAADEQFKADISALQDGLKQHLDVYDAFAATVNKEIGTLKGEVEALKNKDLELQGLIDGIDDRLKKNEELASKNADLLNATVETLNLLQDAHIALETRVGTLETKFNEYQKKIDEQLAQHFAAFEKATQDIANLKAENEKQGIDIAANATAIGGLTEDLKQAKEQLNDRIKAAEEALATYKAEMETTIKGLGDKIDANTKAISLNTEAIAKINAAIDTLKADVKKLQEDLAKLQQELNEKFNTLQGLVDALRGRIQSITYVPTHADNAARIEWAKLGNEIVEAQSSLKFQVRPVECASALTNTKYLSFVFEEVATRAAARLEVVGATVVNKDKGYVEIKVNARDLADNFYEGDVRYATSLVVKDENADIASCFVQLVPAAPKTLAVELINTTGAYEIQYTDLKTAHKVLPNHKFVFSVDGQGAKTVEGMIADGYEIVVTKKPIEYTLSDSQKPNVFKNVESHTDFLNFATVSLKEEKKAAVGLVETVKYTYDVCGTTLDASADVKVTKVQGSIEMKGADIVWNYAEDAQSDAGLVLTTSTDVAKILSEKLPVETKYADVIAGTLSSIAVSVDGAVDPDVTAAFGGTTAEPTITLNNFAWEKNYTITARYELDNIDVTITATVSTKDRGRAPIVVTLPASEVVYAYETVYSFDNSLVDGEEKDIYAQLVAAGVFGKEGSEAQYDEAAFLKLLLETKTGDKYALVNTFSADGAAAVDAVFDTNNVLSTGAQLINAATGFNVKFSYKDVDVLPKSVKHVYDVTTWYGQKITINKTVKLLVPTYDFERVENWVFFDASNYYFSNVLAWYEYINEDTKQLNLFSTQNVNMNAAFRVVTPNGEKLLLNDLSATNETHPLYAEFSIVPGQKVKNSYFDNFALAYLDYNLEKIDVVGALYLKPLVGKNGVQQAIKLTTNFDGEGIYNNYTVKRYDFIQDFEAQPKSLILNNAKVYNVSIPALVKLTDIRPGTEKNYSLLQYKLQGDKLSVEGLYNEYEDVIAALNNPENSGLTIADIKYQWVEGDGQNGFYSGRKADKVYSLEFKITQLTQIPAGLAPQVTFNNGVLRVDATDQLALTAPQTFEFDVDLIFTPAGATEGVVYQPYGKPCKVKVTIAPGN